MRVIKKYPNRRLYDTGKSGYITIADVLKIIRSGEDFQVVDAETGNDITRTVLVQIITEQEAGASPIFTTEMLTRFIRFYDDSSQALFGEFLDKNLQLFTEQQKRFQDQVGSLMGNPLQFMQELTERNMAMWADMQQSFLSMATGSRPKQPEEDPAEKPPRK